MFKKCINNIGFTKMATEESVVQKVVSTGIWQKAEGNIFNI